MEVERGSQDGKHGYTVSNTIQSYRSREFSGSSFWCTSLTHMHVEITWKGVQEFNSSTASRGLSCFFGASSFGAGLGPGLVVFIVSL